MFSMIALILTRSLWSSPSTVQLLWQQSLVEWSTIVTYASVVGSVYSDSHFNPSMTSCVSRLAYHSRADLSPLKMTSRSLIDVTSCLGVGVDVVYCDNASSSIMI